MRGEAAPEVWRSERRRRLCIRYDFARNEIQGHLHGRQEHWDGIALSEGVIMFSFSGTSRLLTDILCRSLVEQRESMRGQGTVGIAKCTFRGSREPS